MPEPWERQPGESDKAFEAFVIYRDMGPDRALREVARRLNKSLTMMAKWSTPHRWVERCAAWDNEQDRIARKAQIDEIKKMRKRHAKLAEDMLVKAANALRYIPEDEIKPSDISKMVEVASRLEQKSRGDTTDAVEMREAEEKQASPVTFYLPDNHRTTEEVEYGELPEE